jgi:type IV pilus assembly protein PilO
MSSGVKKTKIDEFVDSKYLLLEKKKKIIVVSLIFIFPVILFFAFIYLPGAQDIKKIESKVNTSSEELKKARIAARELPRHEKELDEITKEFETTSILLPKGQEIPSLLRNISDLGKSSGLDFLSFVPGVEIPKDFYSEIPIDIKIKGTYHYLGSFLDKVSKLERIVTVNNIKTEKTEQEGEDILLSSSCRLVTYRFTNVKLEQPKKKKK